MSIKYGKAYFNEKKNAKNEKRLIWVENRYTIYLVIKFYILFLLPDIQLILFFSGFRLI